MGSGDDRHRGRRAYTELGEQLERALSEEGPDAALAVYDSFTSRQHRWYWAHDDLSDLGIRLWPSDRVAASIPVLERMAAHGRSRWGRRRGAAAEACVEG